MKIKELVERWEKTGLLEGITKNKDKERISQLLENCARYLIDTEKKGEVTTEICGVMLPCVRRISEQTNCLFDFKELQKVLEHCLSDMKCVADVHAIDAEAEATGLACDYFVSKLKEDKAKQDLTKALAKPARALQINNRS